ncbi:MAG: WYL domain-containing protein [Acidimicrobiales bacterium]
MRADRLVAILLLLQQRGQVTCAEVAEELEVSERTARRDLDALSMAGIPVYAVQGRGGGWRLAGGGRTDLSGLTAEEARALFQVAGPHAAATAEVKAALRKLVRALPEPLRERALAASDAVLVEPSPWGGGEEVARPPLLDRVQQAVVDREQLRARYVDRTGAETERELAPLGIVAKGRSWYLLAQTDRGRRTLRIDRLQAVEPTGERAERPADFDLRRRVVGGARARRRPAHARAGVGHHRAQPPPYLAAMLGTWLAVSADDGGDRVHRRGPRPRHREPGGRAGRLRRGAGGRRARRPASAARPGGALTATYGAPTGSGPSSPRLG